MRSRKQRCNCRWDTSEERMACSFSYFLCLSLQWSRTEAWMKGKEMKKKHAFFSHLTTHLKVVPDSVHLCLIVMKVTNEERNEARIKQNTKEKMFRSFFSFQLNTHFSHSFFVHSVCFNWMKRNGTGKEKGENNLQH